MLADGATVRNQKMLDVFRAFSNCRLACFGALGFNALTSVIPTIEPYSHNLFVDVLTELGILMFILLLGWLKKLLGNVLWLFRRFTDDADNRASITCLYAMFVFQLLIVNEQGYLWSTTLLVLPRIMITWLRLRDESRDAGIAEVGIYNRGEDREYRFDDPHHCASR